MSIKVALAFSNTLFSEGVSRLLEKDNSIEVSEILDIGRTHTAEKIAKLGSDVILTDFTTLYNHFSGLESLNGSLRVILFDTNCGKENIVNAVINKKVSGVLLGHSSPELMIKSIKAVSNGEVWIDKNTVKDLLSGLNAIENGSASLLTEREKEVAGLIGQGYRNKEVAQKLHISEPTVKTHLRKIFQKLNIKTRSELITYAIKNHEIKS